MFLLRRRVPRTSPPQPQPQPYRVQGMLPATRRAMRVTSHAATVYEVPQYLHQVGLHRTARRLPLCPRLHKRDRWRLGAHRP